MGRFINAAVLISGLAFFLAAGACNKQGQENSTNDPGLKARAEPGEGRADAGPDATSSDPSSQAGRSARGNPLQSSVARLLPRETLLLVMSTDLRGLMNLLPLEEMKREARFLYEELLIRTVQTTDYNILAPDNLKEIGIDPDRPVGLAMVDLAEASGVLMLPLLDQDKFKIMLYRSYPPSSPRLTAEVLGDSLIIHPSYGEDEMALLFREDWVFIVFSERNVAMSRANLLAGLKPEDSLERSDNFLKARAGATMDSHVAAFADVDQLLAQTETLRERRDQLYKDSARYYDEYNSFNEPVPYQAPDREPAWDEGADDWKARREAEHKKTISLLKKTWGSISFATLSLKLEDNLEIVADGWIQLKPDSLFSRLLQPGDDGSSPLLLNPGGREPFLLLATRLSIPGLEELIGVGLAAEDRDISMLKTLLSKGLGIQLDRDLKPVLTGGVEIALYLGAPLSRTAREAEKAGDIFPALHKSVDLAVVLGITNPAAVSALLTGLTSHPAASLFISGDEQGGWQLALSDWKTLHLRVTDTRLIAATSREMLTVLTEGPKPEAAQASAAAGSEPGLSTLLVLTPGLPVFLLDKVFNQEWETLRPHLPEPAEPSEAYKALKARLEEKKAQLDKVKRDRHLDTIQTFEQLNDLLGTGSLRLVRDVDGLKIRASHKLGASGVSALLGRMSALMEQIRKTADKSWRQRSMLEGEVYQLEDQLDNLLSPPREDPMDDQIPEEENLGLLFGRDLGQGGVIEVEDFQELLGMDLMNPGGEDLRNNGLPVQEQDYDPHPGDWDY